MGNFNNICSFSRGSFSSIYARSAKGLCTIAQKQQHCKHSTRYDEDASYISNLGMIEVEIIYNSALHHKSCPVNAASFWEFQRKGGKLKKMYLQVDSVLRWVLKKNHVPPGWEPLHSNISDSKFLKAKSESVLSVRKYLYALHLWGRLHSPFFLNRKFCVQHCRLCTNQLILGGCIRDSKASEVIITCINPGM